MINVPEIYGCMVFNDSVMKARLPEEVYSSLTKTIQTGKTIDVANFDHDLYYEELMKRVATSRRKTNVVKTAAGDMDGTFGS